MLLSIGVGLALSDPLEIVYGIPPLLRTAMTLPVPIAVLTLGALVFAGLAWKRRYWGLAGRIHYTLVTLAALAFVWSLYYWNLLELSF